MYRENTKNNPPLATFVDISGMHADFFIKFYAAVKVTFSPCGRGSKELWEKVRQVTG